MSFASLRSLAIDCSAKSSRDARSSASNSASAGDKATTVCFFDRDVMRCVPCMRASPLTCLRDALSPAKSQPLKPVISLGSLCQIKPHTNSLHLNQVAAYSHEEVPVVPSGVCHVSACVHGGMLQFCPASRLEVASCSDCSVGCCVILVHGRADVIVFAACWCCANPRCADGGGGRQARLRDDDLCVARSSFQKKASLIPGDHLV